MNMQETVPTHTSTALVSTGNGSRYLQQLCKHWSHNLETEFTAERGRVVFPRNARAADYPTDAVVNFNALQDGIAVRIDASSADQLEALKGAVERHLDRFAFREAPLTYDWH
jgi:hypothetical protein